MIDFNIELQNIAAKYGLKLRDYAQVCETMDWFDIEKRRIAYEDADNAEEARRCLLLLIQCYLECRDFVCAGLYIREYIDQKFDGAENIAALDNEIKQMLGTIKETIKKKQNKNVFVFIWDALSYDTSCEIPFINELRKSGLSFSNAYAPALHTRASILGYLSGRYFVEDGLFFIEPEDLKKEDSGFLSEIQALGVKINYIRHSTFDPFIHNLSDYKDVSNIMQTCKYWDMIMEVIRGCARGIFFIHVWETHPSWPSGNSKTRLIAREDYIDKTFNSNISQEYREQLLLLRNDALDYSSAQMKFYLELLSTKKDTVVFTSDHVEGTIFRTTTSKTGDEKRIPLIIIDKHIKPGTHKKLFSMIKFSDILRQLIKGTDELIIDSPLYIRQEMEPAYGRNLLRYRRNPQELQRLNTIKEISGYAFFTTGNEEYKFYFHGVEEYRTLSDGADNGMKATGINSALLDIDNNRKINRVDFYRKQIHIDTRKVWETTFKRYPHLKELHRDRADELLNIDNNPWRRKKLKLKAKKLLLKHEITTTNDSMYCDDSRNPSCYEIYLAEFRRVWDSLPNDTPIAFYGHQIAFKHMVKTIDISRKKVVCIIDRDLPANPPAGIPIVRIEDADRYNIKKIILTSFWNRQEMKENVGLFCGDEVEVIDIYDILDSRGCVCRKPFFEMDSFCFPDDSIIRQYMVSQSLETYNNSKSPGEEKENLKRLVGTCVMYEDYAGAIVYMERYIRQDYTDSNEMNILKDELINLLDEHGRDYSALLPDISGE